MSHNDHDNPEPLSAEAFRRRFTRLILTAWIVPPVFGLSFLLFIRMFTPDQMLGILGSPIMHAFLVGTIGFSWWYFARFAGPLFDHMRAPGSVSPETVERRMRTFPLHFWGIFIAYLLIAPLTTILSAESSSEFVAAPVDWFRIHLVALIVSIIVGLPIFFRILDLFGRALQDLPLKRPHVTIKAKVFLVGALIPLLIDTMLVQYYWTRTGYFGFETFVVWLTLELLAVLGSLMFVRSIGQSLAPLEGVVTGKALHFDDEISQLRPQSTDELGVLTAGYRRLLGYLNAHSRLQAISNRVLSYHGDATTLAEVVEPIVELCRAALGGDHVYLFLHEPETDELVCVAKTDAPFRPEGHMRLSVRDQSLAVFAFKRDQTVAVSNVSNDPRASARMIADSGARSLIGAPLRAEGQTIGVLVSTTTQRERRFTSEETTLMSAFAREAASAVHTQSLQEQRAEADRQRAEREEQFRLLLDSTSEAIFGVDLHGNCTFVNPACVRMLGYGHESELLGRNMHELAHHSWPDGTPYPKQECRIRHATLRGESAHSDEEVHWRADGTAFPIEYWSHPIAKDGEVIGAVVAFIDITERKRAEEELRRLSEYNRLLLESTGDGIFGVDRDLRCTFANQAAAAMLGYSPMELYGRDMQALVQHSREDGSPLTREESFICRTVCEDRTFVSSDEVLWQREGTSFPVQYTANPIHEHGHVTGAVVVFRNVAQARAMARKMDYLATHDPLTGLINRREFERRLEHALRTARQEGDGHALCYLDLDQFKVVNDTCGHVAGDELLRQLTSVMQPRVRQTDTLARLGGDEFGILFERCPLDRAVKLAEELRTSVQDFRFVWEDKTFSLGASVGVVAVDDHTRDGSAALSAADAACYVAKDRGRNRVHVYETDDADLAQRHGEMQWVSRIRAALDADRFELYAQPIYPVNASGAAPLYFEILLRMHGDDGQVVPPGAFLPAAERYNLAAAIDRWVIARVFACLREHRERLDDLGLCCINLSGQSLGDDALLQYIIAELRDSPVPADRVCFEVTETTAVANLTRAAHFIRELKGHGVRFALDDFGSGMSSFAYLKTLPVDFLKIDGNFVRDLTRDPVDRAMVQSIHQVGHVMGIHTIAEFVETDATLEALREIGVDYAQGFGLALPRPLDELVAAVPRSAAAGDANLN